MSRRLESSRSLAAGTSATESAVRTGDLLRSPVIRKAPCPALLSLIRVLRYTRGKKAPAARILGIDVKTLTHKIRIYNIRF